MVPARCIKLDEIPQKENGKIDRIFIENTITNLINIKKQDKELTELEIKLLNIWKTYLSVDEISVFDNFFDELGGDSLTAQLITTEIENELSVTLTDNIIYEHSTIYDLATELNKRPNHYFKYIKHIIKGDKKLPPIFWATGYPNVIRKDINYDGDFYYIDSHYNSYATIPSIYDNIEDYCKVRVNEILEIIDNKDIILAGYSIGSVYALELSKQLKEKGKNIKFLFLLDPRDSINVLNNKIINKYKYYSQLILNYIRFIIYYLIWNIQKIFNLKILKRFKYIHSIYAFHRLKYNFSYTNDLTILIQRNNNNNLSKNNFKHLFLHRIYHILNVKKHSDFFNNQSVIKEWMSLFNNYLNSHLN
jgi:acyl carrier protein